MLVALMRHGKDSRVRGTAAQALLERGCGKPRVEVASTYKSDSQSFIEALQGVAGWVKTRRASGEITPEQIQNYDFDFGNVLERCTSSPCSCRNKIGTISL